MKEINTFNITDEEIINAIIDVCCNCNDPELTNTVKILVDFMQFKNHVKGNYFLDKIEKDKPDERN